MDTLKYYDKNAEMFVAETIAADMTAQYENFISRLQKGAQILDLGCGSGRDSRAFIDKGYSVVSIDGSKELCIRAKKITRQPVLCLRFEEIEFESQFDGVWACASILHVEKSNMEDILLRISKALKPGGFLYVSYKYGNEERLVNGRFFSDYNENDIPELFTRTGLSCVNWWVSDDVREDRFDKKWLNIVAQKEL